MVCVALRELPVTCNGSDNNKQRRIKTVLGPRQGRLVRPPCLTLQWDVGDARNFRAPLAGRALGGRLVCLMGNPPLLIFECRPILGGHRIDG